jgi:hydrogenase-4 component H
MNSPATDFLPHINTDKCISCELCVRVCPHNVLGLDGPLAPPILANPDRCEYTGRCEDVCPTGAISLIYEIVI